MRSEWKIKLRPTYQVYSEWVTTQLEGATGKHRLYRLADQWRKFKVGTDQWILNHGVICRQGPTSLAKSIVSTSTMVVVCDRVVNAYMRFSRGLTGVLAPLRNDAEELFRGATAWRNVWLHLIL